MKKILALILALCCVFAVVSCGGDDNDNDNSAAKIDAFKTAIAATNPEGLVITVTTTTALGDAEAVYNVAYAEDGSAIINYSIEKFVEIDPANPTADPMTTETGTVTLNADGTFTGSGLSGTVAELAKGTELDVAAITGATVNDAGDVLTATVAAANTEAVFGVAVAKDVKVEIAIANGVVEQVKLAYEGVTINCVYN